MDDLAIQQIHISGPTLSSLLHQSSSSPADIHGLLFGHVTYSTPSSLSDDPITPPPPSSSSSAIITTTTSHLSATITSFISLPSHLPLPPPPLPHTSLIGYFSSRRKTPPRPSLKETTQIHSLSSSPSFSYKPENTPLDISLTPSIFLLLTTPFEDKLIHTHEYKAFQYSRLNASFEDMSLKVVNVGPGFRGSYEMFLPCFSLFPLMGVEFRGVNSMVEDGNLKDQKALDGCAEGFEIGRLGKMMGNDVSGYSGELEELYGKMIKKLDGLSRMVEKSDNEKMEQENYNMKLRRKVAGLE